MKTATLQMAIRIIGVLEIVLGIIFWTGNGESLVIVHILLGSILTLALFALIYQSYRAGGSPRLVIFAAVWALVLPLWGLEQERIFPETYLWLAQVLHLVFAIGAIGLAEILSGQIRKKSV